VLLRNHIRSLANSGANFTGITCKVLFKQNAAVFKELKGAGCTVDNSKHWWGRLKKLKKGQTKEQKTKEILQVIDEVEDELRG
jgi:hypothetical protein